MIDKLFFIVLVLNATRLFPFLAPQLGISIGQVSLALLALNCFYLIVKIKYSAPLFLRGGVGSFLFVLVLWPLCTVVYAPSVNIREIGLTLYFFSLFFATAVYTVTNGLPAMHRMLSVSLAISIVGMALSMARPDYFESVALLAAGHTVYKGRPFGFFMQPNLMAQGLAFLFIGWFSLRRRKNGLSEVTTILAFLLVMLLTGSRLGILIAVVTVTVGLAYSWRKQLTSGRYLLKICLLTVCLIGGVVATRYYLSIIGDSVARTEYDLIDRMETMLSFELTGEESLEDDVSFQYRFSTHAVYLALANEKPLLGHGFGSDTYYLDNHTLLVSAHSDALTCAMEYGFPYLFAFAFLILGLYRKRSRRSVEDVFQTNSISQFVAVVLILFAIGSFLDLRTFYIVLGMFFAAVFCPHLVFEYDSEGKAPQACMSKKDIRNARLVRRAPRLSEVEVEPT